MTPEEGRDRAAVNACRDALPGLTDDQEPPDRGDVGSCECCGGAMSSVGPDRCHCDLDEDPDPNTRPCPSQEAGMEAENACLRADLAACREALRSACDRIGAGPYTTTTGRTHSGTVRRLLERKTTVPNNEVVVRGLDLPAEFVRSLAGSPSLVEIAPEDRLIPHECFNVKLQVEGEWVAPDKFFNSVSETIVPEINAALLFLKKTRKYTTFSEDAGTELVCKSLDMKHGQWQEPEEVRACELCPFKEWGASPPACKEVWNFVGVNLETGSPFLVSVKSTSIKPMKAFLNTHFLGKLPGGGHLPLYCYRVKLKLVRPKGTYSVLTPELGEAFSQADIERWGQICASLASHAARSIDLEDAREAGNEPETAREATNVTEPAPEPDHMKEFRETLKDRLEAGLMTAEQSGQAWEWAGRVSAQKVREKMDAWENEPSPPPEGEPLPSEEPSDVIGAEGIVALESVAKEAKVLIPALHSYMRGVWIGADGVGVGESPLTEFPSRLYDGVCEWLDSIARFTKGGA